MTAMRVLIATLGAAVATAAAVSVSGSERATAGAEPESFAFAIGNRTLKGPAADVGKRYERFDLVVVDGDEASAAEVEAIRAKGTTALAYLSVGTIERWRPWYGNLKRYRLGAWRDWKDEWFADTSKQALRRKLVRIAEDEILVEGFDGLFLDNVDMVEARRHRAQRAGMGSLVADLDEVVGSGALFAQNGARGVLRGYSRQDVEPLIDHLDGWNREDVTWTYDFDSRRYVRSRAGDRAAALEELDEIGQAGLTTTATDYIDLAGAHSPGACRAVENAEEVGTLPYLSDIGLTLRAVKANPAC